MTRTFTRFVSTRTAAGRRRTGYPGLWSNDVVHRVHFLRVLPQKRASVEVSIGSYGQKIQCRGDDIGGALWYPAYRHIHDQRHKHLVPEQGSVG